MKNLIAKLAQEQIDDPLFLELTISEAEKLHTDLSKIIEQTKKSEGDPCENCLLWRLQIYWKLDMIDSKGHQKHKTAKEKTL